MAYPASPLFWVLFALGSGVLLLIAWRRGLRWRPAGVLRIGLLAAVLAAAFLPETRTEVEPLPQRTVLILDQSDSVTPEDRGTARAQARLWLAAGPNRLLILVGEGQEAAFGSHFPEIGGQASDLAGAFDLAAAYLEAGGGRIVVATDGLPSEPLAAGAALSRLDRNRIELAWIPLSGAAFPADVYVDPIYLPSSMWEHTDFTAVLPVTVFLPGDVDLRVSINEQPYLEQRVNLAAGRRLLEIPIRTTNSEILTIAASVEAVGDPRPENNTAFGALRVFPAPRLLVVTANARIGSNFAQALAGQGLDTDLMSPEDLPESLNELAVYEVILVENVLANDLTEIQMRALKDFAQQLGRGLVFTGGRNAFTLGGYQNTIIEPILPVRLEPPPREQNSPLTLVLVLDRSASMDGARGTPNALRPISLAREAALRSVETLGPEDYLGILSYNTSAVWSLPIQLAGAGDVLQTAKNAMTTLTPSGGTAIYTALNSAVTGLLETETSETRHIVLLSDGNDDTPLEQYAALAEFALAEGITISTIALGVEADQQLMALLADAGEGRFYAVLQATDLPKILIDESRAARDENVHEGAVRAAPGERDHPILTGIPLEAAPPLLGYNALVSRADDGAEDVLISADFEDPLLSVWQYGLGRVAAWTGDLGQQWGLDWTAWEAWGRFWSHILHYTLPDPAAGPGQVDVAVQGGSVQVTARLLTAAGVPRNGAAVDFLVADPSGEVRSYGVPQTGPGEYSLALPGFPPGVYRAVVRFPDESGFPVEAAAPVVVNYPVEWQPAERRPGLDLGEVIAWSDLLPAAGDPTAVRESPNLLLQRLLALLIAAWPLEIAIRRRRMPWR